MSFEAAMNHKLPERQCRVRVRPEIRYPGCGAANDACRSASQCHIVRLHSEIKLQIFADKSSPNVTRVQLFAGVTAASG